MKRPSVKPLRVGRLRAGERIIEFSFPDGAGGLIAFGPGNTVELYRLDAGIKVVCAHQHLKEKPRVEVSGLAGQQKLEPCPGCGRARSACHVMPCLHLEVLNQQDFEAYQRGEDVTPELREWYAAAGVRVERTGR